MQIAEISKNILTILGRTAAVAAVSCCSVVCLQAQQVDQPQLVALNTNAPLDLTAHDLAHAVGANYSSSESSSIDAVDATAAARLDLPEDAAQPPPRRRYGRPRYNDSSHNPDGSSKYAFIAGAGFTTAVSTTSNDLNTSYSYQVGAGRNFNKNFSLLLQFDWDNFGFKAPVLDNESNLYFGANDAATGADGHAHVWSFTLDPVYNIYAREGLGAYVVGGVGFYHKVSTFTVPQTEVYYDPYFGAEEYQANETFAHFTSNAVGFNGGFGLTFKPSRFSGQRLYGEVRYVYVNNQFKPGYTVQNQNTTTYTGNNGYPANSLHTSYIPVKFGIRF